MLPRTSTICFLAGRPADVDALEPQLRASSYFAQTRIAPCRRDGAG
jgi:hypothetical protein